MLHKKSRFIVISVMVITTWMTGFFVKPLSTALAQSIDMLRNSYFLHSNNVSPKKENASSPLETLPYDAITYNSQVENIVCHGDSENVYGNRNTLTFWGNCGEITLHGNYNWVTLKTPATVYDRGEGNNIAIDINTTLAGQAIEKNRYYITGIINFADNNQVRKFNCYSADVVLYGDGNDLHIEGACSSLTIRGNANSIHLEKPTLLFNSGRDNIVK